MKNHIIIRDVISKYSNFIIKSIGVLLFTGLFTISLSAQVARPDDRDDFAKQAKAQYENGNWESGKKIVDDGLKKYPKDPDLKMLSGKYFHHKKQFDRARYELIKSLEQNPHNVDAKQVLVNVEIESKRYSSAICYVNELLEVNPYWKGLWRKKIELYELQGNTVEANRLRKRIAQIYPEDSQLKKDYFYNSELEANTKRKTGQIDDAIEIRKNLIQAEPQKLDHYLTLINDYLQAGDQHNAMTYTERGLSRFPGNMALINKKAGILSEQKRYSELLSFLQQQIRRGNSGALQQQYNYYLLEAARNSKDQDPATLYGKVFERNPGNEEAFSYIFNNAIGNQQYEEALNIVSRYRHSRGTTKELSLKELMVYNRMGNTSRASSLTKQLFARYPDDTDLKDAYMKIILNEAKAKMADENYTGAVADWKTIKSHSDDHEMYNVAQKNLYNAYLAMDDYNNALNTLTDIINVNPENAELYLKKADIYKKLQRYNMALSSYEQALKFIDEEQKPVYLASYGDLLTGIVKELNEQFRYTESMQFVKRWMDADLFNKQALRYAVNLSHLTKNQEDMLMYAEKGVNSFPDDVFFKLKLAQIKGLQPANYEQVHAELQNELQENPYHEEVINTFVQVSEDYGKYLIKNSRSQEALKIFDTALVYTPQNKILNYLKGTAYEKLKDFDQAYTLQSFYEPSLLELNDFRQHLNYLKYRSYKNQIGISHLRSRFGDNYTISSISTLEYTRFANKNTYSGRVHYAGREPGKGVQIQGEWNHDWSEKTRTKIDAAWANQFFPKINISASAYHDVNILQEIEAELGLGYRRLAGNENLMNVVVGATKDIDPWRLNVRFNNFMLDGTYLYNLSANARYHFSSPKNYIMTMGSIGSSPDVDLINYQLYNGFSVLNTMVGAGVGHMIYRTISAGVLGTWHNYQTHNALYRNLYNIYFTLNVAF